MIDETHAGIVAEAFARYSHIKDSDTRDALIDMDVKLTHLMSAVQQLIDINVGLLAQQSGGVIV